MTAKFRIFAITPSIKNKFNMNSKKQGGCMKNSIARSKYFGIFLVVIISGLLLQSCKKTDKFLTVISSGKITSLAIDKVNVHIQISRNNLMENNLIITNKSKDIVTIEPQDVVLYIENEKFVLPAIIDFKKYVTMRYTAAKTECSQSKYPYPCADSIESFFKPFLNVKPFEFGTIKPGEKRGGLIAFNLPDPFNRSEEAQCLADSLRTKFKLLDGKIVVHASKKSQNLEFNFPVNVTTFTDEKFFPLNIMRNF
jgi:hypothetical protein